MTGRFVATCGLLLCATLAGAQQLNPAMREQPVLSDPDHAMDQARLNRIHQSAGGQLESRLSAISSIGCDLSEEATWMLTLFTTREEYEFGMSSVAESSRPRVTLIDTRIVDGHCVDGWPEGEFAAVTQFETVTESFGMTSLDRRRVTGAVRDGQLHGEFVYSGISTMDMPVTGQRLRNVSHGIARFEHGEQTGRGTSIAFQHDNDGLNQIVTNTQRVESPGVIHTMSWMGSMLMTESTSVDGQPHGWVVSHPVEVMRGHPSDMTRACYQFGQPAGDAACGVDAAPAMAESIHVRPRLRRGPERDMLEELQQLTQRVVPGTQREFETVASICEPTSDAIWAIGYGELAGVMMARNPQPDIKVRILRGQCVDGYVDGPFEVLVRVETPSEGGATGTLTVSRATGEMRGNQRHGRWYSARTLSSNDTSDRQSYTIADYADNALAGPRVSFIGGDTTIERPAGEARVVESEYYLGDFLRERFVARDGVRDGTSTTYVRNRRNIVRCFQNGVVVREGACRGRR